METPDDMRPNSANSITQMIAFYGRVSTSNQEDQKTIENQFMAMREFADEKFGVGKYVVVKEYRDEGWSGDILERPALDELRLDAKRKIWDIVVVYDPDRLSRRYAHQEFVMGELEDARIVLLFVTTPPPKDDQEKVIHGIKGLFSQWERLKIRERFRLGKLRKARDGHIIATEAPYGYSLIRRKGKPTDADFVETHYVIDESEAIVARQIFDWIGNQGLTTRKVVKLLMEEGIKPRWSERGVWSTGTINTMIRNTVYIGNAHYGASYAVVPDKPLKKEVYKRNKKTSRRMRPKEEWIPITVPALLGGEQGKILFERAQEQMRINLERCVRNKKNEYLVGGKIRCVCSSTRTGEGPQKGKHLYYRCANRVKNYPAPPTCIEKGINARIADLLVWDEIVRLMGSSTLMLEQIQRWQESRKGKTSHETGSVEVLMKELEALKATEKRYKTAYGADAFTLAELKEYVAPLQEKMQALQERIRGTQSRKNDAEEVILPDLKEVEAFARMAEKTLRNLNFSQKRVIVMDVVEGIVGTPKELVVRGHIPVSNYSSFSWSYIDGLPTIHVKQQTSHRNRRASQRR